MLTLEYTCHITWIYVYSLLSFSSIRLQQVAVCPEYEACCECTSRRRCGNMHCSVQHLKIEQYLDLCEVLQQLCRLLMLGTNLHNLYARYYNLQAAIWGTIWKQFSSASSYWYKWMPLNMCLHNVLHTRYIAVAIKPAYHYLLWRDFLWGEQYSGTLDTKLVTLLYFTWSITKDTRL